ncbi:hypothetical protein ACERCG_05775 [Mannheimia sp. E30BD]|uniref:hypothetical protein n=1 Tax=Mannheimia sp. E30BD TaxID=3278708 RepID=UPI00359F003B
MKEQIKLYREILNAVKEKGIEEVEQAINQLEAQFNLTQEIYQRHYQMRQQGRGRARLDAGAFFQRCQQEQNVLHQISADCELALEEGNVGTPSQAEEH